MKYKEMLESAKAKGLASEAIMWESIDDVEAMLCELKEREPARYWRFMRKQHGMLYKNHYDEDFAMWDVRNLKYKGKNGEARQGAHWNLEQVKDATKGLAFAGDVTDWDKYVAYNAMYSDMCRSFDDADILTMAYDFYFKDEDAPQGKIWIYMSAMHNM